MNIQKELNSIVEHCDILHADDTITFKEFGKNKDLTLYIHKDCDYDVETDNYNMVSISTKQNEVWVDDTGDVHIDDLYRELERIYNYKDLETF